jgi:hypothetical protein
MYAACLLSRDMRLMLLLSVAVMDRVHGQHQRAERGMDARRRAAPRRAGRLVSSHRKAASVLDASAMDTGTKGATARSWNVLARFRRGDCECAVGHVHACKLHTIDVYKSHACKPGLTSACCMLHAACRSQWRCIVPSTMYMLVLCLVSLAYKHIVHVVVELLLRLHDLLDQPQRRAQWQTDNVVVRALDALNQDGACRLYAVSTSLVVSVSRAHVGQNKLVGDCVSRQSLCRRESGTQTGEGLPWGSNLTVVSSTCVSIL